MFNAENKLLSGTISWENGAILNFQYRNEEGKKSIRFQYCHTDYKGNKSNMDYTVQIVSVPSNLGKGENLYFLCPVSYKRCKAIFMAYGSTKFKRRSAYQTRIYYMTQKRSHHDRHLYRYFDLEDQLKEIYTKGYKETYKGKQTRVAHRVKMLEIKKQHYNNLRLSLFIERFGYLLDKK